MTHPVMIQPLTPISYTILACFCLTPTCHKTTHHIACHPPSTLPFHVTSYRTVPNPTTSHHTVPHLVKPQHFRQERKGGLPVLEKDPEAKVKKLLRHGHRPPRLQRCQGLALRSRRHGKSTNLTLTAITRRRSWRARRRRPCRVATPSASSSPVHPPQRRKRTAEPAPRS